MSPGFERAANDAEGGHEPVLGLYAIAAVGFAALVNARWVIDAARWIAEAIEWS